MHFEQKKCESKFVIIKENLYFYGFSRSKLFWVQNKINFDESCHIALGVLLYVMFK